MTRRLDAEERALWQRVIESVNPLQQRRPLMEEAMPALAEGKALARAADQKKVRGRVPEPLKLKEPPKPPRASVGETLDGGWDRRLSRGAVMPDFAVDLHGHTLDSAYRLLDASLDRAVRSGARVVLLITGKPPRADRIETTPRRGAIRAAVGDWLGSSRFAGHIAAVRNAHPRHGGAGALYIILKRDRAAR